MLLLLFTLLEIWQSVFMMIYKTYLSSILSSDLLLILGDLKLMLGCGIDPQSCGQTNWVALELMIIIKLVRIFKTF